ncbi:MAG: DeoR/GlpR family DNA-binding transcription regulator, partial [Burkholderiales bacterium]
RPLGTMTGNTLEDFISLLHRLRNQRLLAGLYFDEDEIFMKEEEHFSWKVKTFVDAKRRIARRALQEIHSRDLIALDGGSTTNEIAKHLGRSLRLHRLTQLRVVTNSLPAAHELLSLASEMGLEDKSEVLQVFIAGGRVRSNTLAVVGLGNEAEENVYNLLSKLGGASICFIGANGIFDGGFTTRTLEEAQTKKAILSSSKRRVIVTDASKFGLRQEQIFADFDNGIEIITVRDGFERALEQYEALLASRNTAFTYA